MSIETGPVLLLQWLSPAYPVGAFAWSHGLEAAVARNEVADGAGLEAWLGDLLLFGSARADAILLAAAFHAANGAVLAEVDATARAFAPSRERLAETVEQGAAFCRATSGVWGGSLRGLTYPVAVGRAACMHGLPLALTLEMFTHALAANLIAAGQRLLPVGQIEGQRILKNLGPLVSDAAKNALTADLSGLSSACFAADIASMAHETQYARIFRS
ncbi:urease accessory protein UreF [Leisingera sp.]|uniref:urease accessory protein UreF n=1 Tax=Leisingera sp. TaxID=1879318 RepID=UPI002B26FEC5|nr:urease accessory UreF family protein [Leisingera sp.]